MRLNEFHEWIELYEWQFNPILSDGKVIYRWVNETYSGQATTKELYDIFIEQNNSQTEISNEEIEKESYIKFPILTYSVMEGHDDFNRVMRDSWVEGIKWYREQLNKKQ